MLYGYSCLLVIIIIAVFMNITTTNITIMLLLLSFLVLFLQWVLILFIIKAFIEKKNYFAFVEYRDRFSSIALYRFFQ